MSNVGAAQFSRYLEDAVGEKSAAKIEEHQWQIAEEISGKRLFQCNGYMLDKQNDSPIIRSAFRVVLNPDEDPLKLCRHFKAVYDFNGISAGWDSFDAIHSDRYRKEAKSFSRKLFSRTARKNSREISEKVQEYAEFDETASEPVRRLIKEIPIVICPLSDKVVSAYFGEEAELYYVERDNLNSEDYFTNLRMRDFFNWGLEASAYGARMDVAIVEYPSGRHGFAKFVNQSEEPAETAQATVTA